MTAKKNIIKELRQEIKDLEAQIANNKLGMRTREKWFSRVQATHKSEIHWINIQTNNIASALRCRFLKEMTWLELCDDPDSKMQIVKQAIKELKLVARNKDDDN